MCGSLCQRLGNMCFLPLRYYFLLQYNVFFCCCDAIPKSIISLYFLKELLCHRSDKLQFPQWGAGASSISSWDQRNSLYPKVFSQRCFTTAAEASVSKHRLRSALWKTDWIIHSQPPRQCQPASYSVFGGRRATSCYSPPAFFLLFWHSQGSHDDWHDVSS